MAYARCPRCNVRFKSEERVVRHLNQPVSECKRDYDRLVRRLAKTNHRSLRGVECTARSQSTADGPPTIPSIPLSQESTLPFHPPSVAGIDEAPQTSELIPAYDIPSTDNSNNTLEPLRPTEDSWDGAAKFQQSFYVEEYPGAAHVYSGNGLTFQDRFNRDKLAALRADNPFYPFASREEWELADFLLESSLGMAEINRFLKLSIVCCFILLLISWFLTHDL